MDTSAARNAFCAFRPQLLIPPLSSDFMHRFRATLSRLKRKDEVNDMGSRFLSWFKSVPKDLQSDGPYESHYENGRLRAKGIYKDGQPDGPSVQIGRASCRERV